MRFFSIILLCVLIDTALVANAEPGVDEMRVQKFPLSKFLPWQQSIALRNVKATYDVFFPLPERYWVRGAKLHLELTNSNVLIGSRSQLIVRLNQSVIGQIKLDPDNPRTFADIVLPLDKLIPGYNQLRFITAQHYTDDQCEVPDAPELWTEIDPVKSNLQLEYTLRSKKPTLAAIPFYIDEKLPEYRFDMVRPATEYSVEDLRWGALIAQGVALRLQHVPMDINSVTASHADLQAVSRRLTLNETSDDQRDTILLGKYADIKAHLSSEIAARITGPYLGIYPLDSDSTHFIMIVSGSTNDDVSLAVEAFASINYPLPDTADTVIKNFDRPPVKAYQMTGLIQPDTVYSFKQLGYRTTSMREGGDKSVEMKIVMPADLYAREDADVGMQLHLAYGAAMRRDSTINISLNGTFQQAIHLRQIGGAHFRDYRIVLPLRLFKPGQNTLAFHPVLTPLETGECLYRQHSNLVVSLFDDSLLSFPPADHFARLPDLELLRLTGFPFLRVPDGSELGIQTLDKSSASVLSTWQIGAKLAQIGGLPLSNATLAFQPIKQDLNLVMIGDSHNMDPALMVGAPLQLGNENQIPYPLQPVTHPVETPIWENWMARLSGEPEVHQPAELEYQNVVSQQSGGLGQYALAMAYESPIHSNRMVMAITHEQQLDGFYQSVKALVSPSVWSLLQGNIAVWKDGSTSFAWQQTDDEFFVGETTQSSRMAYYFSLHPLVWIVTVIILLLLFAWLVHWLLNRFKTQHHPNAKEIDS